MNQHENSIRVSGFAKHLVYSDKTLRVQVDAALLQKA